jgi:hypothetical protein
MLKFLDQNVFQDMNHFHHDIWIKFTLDTNWIGSISKFITSINRDSTQCWNAWITMFFIL